ncbi:GTP 3',8-cyclase MoaA [Salinibacter altiplanensis]|uniref:GTP 3',8-cyclase MoaA n=1 Tax=Salinibacter altiplanensis TaxID=1803181 RepID=UPI000C9FCF6C|nr:GTP 3',8-cyclase MoaA [Salinibacter altiplanensis]
MPLPQSAQRLDDRRSAAEEKDVDDQFGRRLRDLRISVIDRCNFRCDYCMPMETYGEDYSFLDPDHYLSFDEIERLVRLFSRRGVRKIRITGGEPLLRPNLDELIDKISGVQGIEDIALTTNGYLLEDQASALADAGLHRVTVSLDALDPELYREMNGVGKGPEPVLDGIEAADEAGLEPIKINTVVRRGINDESVLPLVRHFRGTGRIVRFIEYMDVGTRNGWDRSEVVPSAELKDRISDAFPIDPLDSNYPGEVANRYAFTDGTGEIGFVSSITNPFCGDCTRARLSTEGTLYTCLFANEGEDFRSLLRDEASDAAILDQIDAVWGRRDDRYSEERTEEGEQSDERIEMYQIGG